MTNYITFFLQSPADQNNMNCLWRQYFLESRFKVKTVLCEDDLKPQQQQKFNCKLLSMAGTNFDSLQMASRLDAYIAINRCYSVAM